MKNNDRGFTLVELLAAMTIVGILSVFAIPKMIDMFSGTRTKMYISDARKMISQAEYKVRANNNSIELPDPGDCIVISLKYLDSTEFDNPPHEGSYLDDRSFVVVKNLGTEFEYAVNLVEQTKSGDYIGVQLATYNQVTGHDSSSYAVLFSFIRL